MRYCIFKDDPVFSYNINIGEHLFRHGAKIMLRDHQCIRENELICGDFFIILISNCITIMHTEFIKQLRDKCEKYKKKGINIIFMGCGSQANINEITYLTDEFVDALKRITDGNTIGVRGKYTQDLMNRYSINSMILGCPSIFCKMYDYTGGTVNENYIDRPLSYKLKVAFQSIDYGICLASKCLDIYAMKYDADFFPQTEYQYLVFRKNKLKMSEIIDIIDNNYIKDPFFNELHKFKMSINKLSSFNFPVIEFNKYIDYMTSHAQEITSINDWICKINKYDFIISSRIHGTICGLSAGIRALCVAHDSRTIELCETLDVPYITSFQYDDDIMKFYNMANPSRYHERLKVLMNNYKLFFDQYGITISDNKIAPIEIERQISFNNLDLYPVYNFFGDSNFNVTNYKKYNPDICNITDDAATYHYYNWGKNEGRIYKIDLPNDFNVEKYKQNNPDLTKLSDPDAERHYYKYGRHEGRKYN